MKRLYLLYAIILAVLISFSGCAGQGYIFPKELQDTKILVENARYKSRDLKCPEAYYEVLKLWEETLDAYENPCEAEKSWMDIARVVREKVGALCPKPPKIYAAKDEKLPQRPVSADSDGDGVPDSIDKCPGTPPNVEVDSYGCPKLKDSDGDGVPDLADRCPRTPQCAKVDASGCWICDDVNFDFNKWDIKPQFTEELNKLAECLKDVPYVEVNLEGHADIIGTDEYNQRLSEKRAGSVKEFLVKRGVQEKRLLPKGFGKKRPVASNKTEEGRAKNRRVEIKPIY